MMSQSCVYGLIWAEYCSKEQPDVTSYIPCILSLACNWSIGNHIWLRPNTPTPANCGLSLLLLQIVSL